MNCPRWEDVRDDWEDDGAFVEVSNSDMTPEDWQRVLDALHSSSWPLELDLAEGPVPLTATELFRGAAEGTYRLVVRPSEEVSVDCYAYWSFDTEASHPTKIECNFSKFEIRGQPQLDTFCEFVQALGRAVRKPLLVADEGLVHPIMRYEPATGRVSAPSL